MEALANFAGRCGHDVSIFVIAHRGETEAEASARVRAEARRFLCEACVALRRAQMLEALGMLESPEAVSMRMEKAEARLEELWRAMASRRSPEE